MKRIIIKENKTSYFLKEIYNSYNIVEMYGRKVKKILNKKDFISSIGEWKKNIKEYDEIIIFDTFYKKKIAKYIKRKNPKCRIIMFFWNPIRDNKRKEYLRDENIDEFWTFDPVDARKYNINYNSQFYSKNIKLEDKEKNIDLFFLGRNKGRKDTILKLQREAESLGIKTNFIINENEKKLVTFDEYKEYLSHSKAILDIMANKQNGLTLRAMESIFYKIKLVTDNKEIKKYEFYNSNNIFIIGEDKLENLNNFINSPYEQIDEKIVNYYDIENWLKRFEENDCTQRREFNDEFDCTEKQRLLKAIENLNAEKREIINSREYKLGYNILSKMRNIKHLEIKKIKKNIDKKLKMHRISKIMKQVKLDRKEDVIECKGETEKRVVIYTGNICNYDKIQSPLYCANNVNYVVYSNYNSNLLNWQRRNIPENIAKLKNPTLINRYIKMHPAELFPEYDYSIYLDSNIRTVSDITSFINNINSNTGIAMFRHHLRNSIYTEEKICQVYKKGNKENLKKQIQMYRKEKFPEDFGLLEGNVIVVDLKNEKAKEIMDKWWEEFYKSGSLRDQISLPYTLWKLGHNVQDIGNLGYDVYMCPKLEFIKHKRDNI